MEQSDALLRRTQKHARCRATLLTSTGENADAQGDGNYSHSADCRSKKVLMIFIFMIYLDLFGRLENCTVEHTLPTAVAENRATPGKASSACRAFVRRKLSRRWKTEPHRAKPRVLVVRSCVENWLDTRKLENMTKSAMRLQRDIDSCDH